jgi:glycosyltransferase involved in cell wall biosynthesis
LADPKKIKVAFIFNHAFFLGGGEASFFELIKSIDAAKFKPVAMVPGRGEIQKRFISHNDACLTLFLPALKTIAVGLPLVALLKLVFRFIKSRIDIIHVNGSRACFYAGLAGRLVGIPVVWHVRESLGDRYMYDGLLAVCARTIICVSESVQRKRFGRFAGRIIKKTTVVHNGVDTARFVRQADARHRIRNTLMVANEILFGIVANIVPLKGQDFFLRGFGRAKLQKPDLCAKALIIGRILDPAYHRKLRRDVSELHLEDSVVFMDFTSDIHEIYSALDIFVLPSEREGFSRSLIEAMSASLPVLATNIAAIAEAVTNGENGILVDYDDVDRMAAAIIKLCCDHNFRGKSGPLNRQKAVSHFDLAGHARRVEKIYNDILADHP